jgi:hypothetical protein
MRRQIVQAPMPIDDALHFRRLEGKLAEARSEKRGGIRRELPSENCHEIRLHQHRARRQIGYVARDGADTRACKNVSRRSRFSPLELIARCAAAQARKWFSFSVGPDDPPLSRATKRSSMNSRDANCSPSSFRSRDQARRGQVLSLRFRVPLSANDGRTLMLAPAPPQRSDPLRPRRRNCSPQS